MSARRFHDGDREEFDGLKFRVVKGAKLQKGTGVPDLDLKLQVFVNGSWRAVTIDLAFFLFDFLYENENVLYPPDGGYQGGKYTRNAISVAMNHGWRVAVDQLHRERMVAENQRQLWDAS